MSKHHILIAGATGFVGGTALKLALADPDVESVTVLVRRALPADAERTNEEKLNTVVVEEFSSLNWDELAQNAWWSELTGVVWALGNPIHKTDLKLPEYEKMTIDWPVACASRLPPNANFVFVTGAMVTRNNDAWGPGAVTRNVKGRAESQLLALPNLAGGHILIARPGGIVSDSSTFLSSIASSFIIKVGDVAQFVLEGAKRGVIEEKDTWECGDMVKFVAKLKKDSITSNL